MLSIWKRMGFARLHVFDQGERVSNTGFTSNGSHCFICNGWWGQGNNRTFHKIRHLGQRPKVCNLPGIACPGGLGQGNQKKKGLNYLFWKVPSTNTSSLWPILNSLQKKWSFHTKSVATLRITPSTPMWHKEAKYDWYAPSSSDKGYGSGISSTKIILGKWSRISDDDACVQSVFVVQVGFPTHFRIQAAN